MICRLPLAVILSASLLISACTGKEAGYAAKVADCPFAPDKGRIGPATLKLLAIVSKMNLTNPIADLDVDLSRGNRRFIGIVSHGCTEPGIGDGDRDVASRFRTECLEGTGDIVEGNLHRALTDAATSYALKYNTELVRRIRTGKVA